MVWKEIQHPDSEKKLEPEGFKEIPPGNITKEDAGKFWQRHFYGERTCFLTESELMQRIRDCSEDQFHFENVPGEETKEILQQFDEDTWSKADLSEREVLIEKLVEQIGKDLELEKIPNVFFYEGIEGECGFYSERFNSIGINTVEMDDVKEVIDTVAHEVRHAYQRNRADIGETEMDQVYKYGFEHYITPVYDEYGNTVNYMEYYDQLIEAEARAFARCFVDRGDVIE